MAIHFPSNFFAICLKMSLPRILMHKGSSAFLIAILSKLLWVNSNCRTIQIYLPLWMLLPAFFIYFFILGKEIKISWSGVTQCCRFICYMSNVKNISISLHKFWCSKWCDMFLSKMTQSNWDSFLFSRYSSSCCKAALGYFKRCMKTSPGFISDDSCGVPRCTLFVSLFSMYSWKSQTKNQKKKKMSNGFVG